MADRTHVLERRAAEDATNESLALMRVLESDLQAMWDRAADWWASHLRKDKNRRLQVFPLALELLGPVRGRNVLDAGCGEGSFARLLADAGATVTGVDFSRLLDIGMEQEAREPRGIRFIKSSLAGLAAVLPEAGTFDAAVCNLVPHCLPDLEPALRAIHAQLKPGGVLVLSDFHPDTFEVFSRAWTACVPVGGIEYRYTLSADCPELTLFLHPLPSLVSACQRCGFEPGEILAPAAPSHGVDATLPQFVFLRLRRHANE
jgi:2-polyprenyl-3-methyl-5-hydroxy-6-metoxy-1,4-benzoquinol methylase